MNKLGIGIVSFDRPVKLRELIVSIEQNTRRPHEIVIFDNNDEHSCDEVKAYIALLKKDARAVVLSEGRNCGPYHAYNVLYSYFYQHKKEMPFFVKIDDDCVINRKNWDDVMLAPFDRDDKVGLVTCRLGNPANFPEYDNGTIRQCSTEFFAMRTQMYAVVGPVIEEWIDGTRLCYSFDSEWTERFGYYGLKIKQVENVYAAIPCGTMKRAEVYPGEKKDRQRRIDKSVKAWQYVNTKRRQFMKTNDKGRFLMGACP